MSELAEITNKDLYLQALSSVTQDTTYVLKYEDSFAIIDRRGNIRPLGVENHGVFCDGTRFLSRLVMNVDGKLPVLLSSEMNDAADLLIVNLTNPVLQANTSQQIIHDTIHFQQRIFLWNNTLYLRVVVTNYGLEAVEFPLSFDFDGDFADIFEVRGVQRERHGEIKAVQIEAASARLHYEGLDQIERYTHLAFSPESASVQSQRTSYRIALQPGQSNTLDLLIACSYDATRQQVPSFDAAYQQLEARRTEKHAKASRIESSDAQFDQWIKASQRDILLLLTKTDEGLYPYAGVPWFSTVFGRDGIITALQTLWFYPDIARGVLSTLMALQATVTDIPSESEPGKILHEQRSGELAHTGEIPFTRYYGTIDATPLFLVLAGRYFQHTGDRAFLEQLWPSIEAALNWIDAYGDSDGDGFVEYRRKTDQGIVQQGWKDSNDSVFYEDGEMVEPPVALCEVQGYVYEARLLIAEIAEAIGKADTAQTLKEQALHLRERFHQAFWMDELATYAIALDADKRPCRIRSSNAGHCLFSGIASAEHAQHITEQLLGPDFFSGWGIRTLAVGEPRYNPISYHNGSIWPHDNALIAYGMARYGFKEAASRVLDALFEVSNFVELNRLPELFCGFDRRDQQGPILYPVACSPQAWAAGSLFMLLQACLGLTIDGIKRQVQFDHPVLPASIESLRIQNLRVGAGIIDLELRRNEEKIDLVVTRNTHDIPVHLTV